MVFVICQPQRDNALGILLYRYYKLAEGRLTSLEYKEKQELFLTGNESLNGVFRYTS